MLACSDILHFVDSENRIIQRMIAIILVIKQKKSFYTKIAYRYMSVKIKFLIILKNIKIKKATILRSPEETRSIYVHTQFIVDVERVKRFLINESKPLDPSVPSKGNLPSCFEVKNWSLDLSTWCVDIFGFARFKVVSSDRVGSIEILNRGAMVRQGVSAYIRPAGFSRSISWRRVHGKSSSARGGVRDAYHAGINRASRVASKRWYSTDVVPNVSDILALTVFRGSPSSSPSGRHGRLQDRPHAVCFSLVVAEWPIPNLRNFDTISRGFRSISRHHFPITREYMAFHSPVLPFRIYSCTTCDVSDVWRRIVRKDGVKRTSVTRRWDILFVECIIYLFFLFPCFITKVDFWTCWLLLRWLN